MLPPIFISAIDGLMIFESAQAVEAYLEPIDVERGEYRSAWDRKGTQLHLGVHTRRVKRRWLPGERLEEHVCLSEGTAVEPDVLLQTLRAYAQPRGIDIQPAASLDDAIAAVRARYPSGAL